MELKLYMKSGNQIIITHVDDCKVNYINNDITGLNVTWSKNKPNTGVMIGSIALNQIEAVETI